jgi:hypothetical protein
MAVHNLEHGGISIQYGTEVPVTEVEKIREFYLDDPTALLVFAVPALRTKVALVAWTAKAVEAGATSVDTGKGHVAMCPRFNEAGFSVFRRAYQQKSPAKFPKEMLQPGMGM